MGLFMVRNHSFENASLLYSTSKWVDFNLDDESESEEAIFSNAIWLSPKNEADEYLRRGTCILIKEFPPEFDVLEREMANDLTRKEVDKKLEINSYETCDTGSSVFDSYVFGFMGRDFARKETESNHTALRARYFVKEKSFSLLIVIKYFESTSPIILSDIIAVIETVKPK
jgi:hypothetical protein